MGLFVTFEGIDGSGKTTITQYIHNSFVNKKISVMLTRESGGNVIAQKIRHLILDQTNKTMDDKTEALLYAASRRQHLVEKILPALSSGTLVLCDRFVDSSIAYQGYGREIGAEAVLSINQLAIGNHMPDMTFFLDVDLEVGLGRVNKRDELDRLETSGNDFFKRTYDGYQAIIKNNPRIRIIDASRTVEAIADEIIELIEKELK